MTMNLRCGDVVPGCPAEISADTEDDVMRQAAEHARTEHGLTELDDDTIAAVRGAITTS
jgi:predicted small metal-binding protein